MQKGQQGGTLFGIEGEHLLAGGFSFAAMPENRFEQVAGTAVMQQLAMAIDGFRQAHTPQRGGAPFAAAGKKFRAIVRQTVAHVM